jgi:hypothetical protein
MKAGFALIVELDLAQRKSLSLSTVNKKQEK